MNRLARTVGMVTAVGIVAVALLVPVSAQTGPGVDPRVAAATERFLAGDYAGMYDDLAGAARDDDLNALRLLWLVHRSGHPATEVMTGADTLRTYARRTGSTSRFGTGWPDRLAALGDPVVGRLLRGGETADEMLDGVRFFSARGAWMQALELAGSIFHNTGGETADTAYGILARSGLHDAAAAGLQARINAVMSTTDPSFGLTERFATIGAYAKQAWDARHIGVVNGLVDMMSGMGGPDALTRVSDFTREDLMTAVAVRESSPARWAREPVGNLFGDVGRDVTTAIDARAREWWRVALSRGKWLRAEQEHVCTRLCPDNLRACDRALGDGLVPRSWRCLTPDAVLIPHERWRGSVAEADCLKKLFADQRRVPRANGGEMVSFRDRFRTAQGDARCTRS